MRNVVLGTDVVQSHRYRMRFYSAHLECYTGPYAHVAHSCIYAGERVPTVTASHVLQRIVPQSKVSAVSERPSGMVLPGHRVKFQVRLVSEK